MATWLSALESRKQPSRLLLRRVLSSEHRRNRWTSLLLQVAEPAETQGLNCYALICLITFSLTHSLLHHDKLYFGRSSLACCFYLKLHEQEKQHEDIWLENANNEKVSATCMPHQSNQPGSIFLNIPLKNKVSINNFPLPNETYYHYTYLLSGYNFQRNYSVIYLKISCTISNHNDRLVAMVLKTKKESQQGGKK
jgi:hypothetical protein